MNFIPALAALALTLLALTGCATVKPLSPEAARQVIASHLQQNPEITPWKFESFLRENHLSYHYRQDSWNGMDHWEIAGGGSWTATYPGMARSGFNDNLIIPGSLDHTLNKDAPQETERHVYYDTLTDHQTGTLYIFNREAGNTSVRPPAEP